MGGREAEGNGLLNRHTGITRIAGSNPAPSANFYGKVAEWLKAHPWKGCIRGTVSRVRISLFPPCFSEFSKLLFSSIYSFAVDYCI